MVLPEEEAKGLEPGEVKESTADSKVCCNAFTQTPRQRPRRRGGRGSRARRMLAYQFMLTVKRGLPLSKLLTNQKTEARSKAELQSEKFASPTLKVKEEVFIKEEKFEDVFKVEVKEGKGGGGLPRGESFV